ncbi:type III secretion system export apparatus subunit SctR [Gluconobacter kondonii]|uniref:type III secretion system export apparatus subunit SctR n=1 Tax=Gluconobacter kondonii TaxID=941463 RepID=UPI001B8BBD9C|nr:type III secretion system export apparatus subunit SctR [Gluconobacter kondonii]MBS1077792.1 type III secretion system export apparatus subunit SctR [Gluconobacter kondonii]
MIGSTNLVTALVLTLGFGVLILAVITTTSFVKISVVLFLLRTALGIQQSPPNIVLYAISLILTLFISAPLGHDIYTAAMESDQKYETLTDYVDAYERVQAPVAQHLLRFTQAPERNFFMNATQRLWPEDMRDSLTPESLPILLPSFLTGELKRAFEIGFLIYLPFITIDLVVTTILIAMGLSQVQPNTISVPLKLLLFVLASGWTRLLHGLVMSYA